MAAAPSGLDIDRHRVAPLSDAVSGRIFPCRRRRDAAVLRLTSPSKSFVEADRSFPQAGQPFEADVQRL